MAITLHSTAEAATKQGVKMLVYGNAGAGKTTLCATLTPYNPVILSAESGLLSLTGYQLPYTVINTVQDLMDAYNWLASSREAAQFGAVCIDSISEIAEVVLSNAKANAKDPRQAYGVLIDEVTKAVRAFRDLPGRHVYVTAKCELQKSDMGPSKYAPMMPGAKLGAALPYLFDEVFFLGISPPAADGTTFRFLQTVATFDKDCKDRSNKLEAYEPPDLNHVIHKIIGA